MSYARAGSDVPASAWASSNADSRGRQEESKGTDKLKLKTLRRPSLAGIRPKKDAPRSKSEDRGRSASMGHAPQPSWDQMQPPQPHYDSAGYPQPDYMPTGSPDMRNGGLQASKQPLGPPRSPVQHFPPPTFVTSWTDPIPPVRKANPGQSGYLPPPKQVSPRVSPTQSFQRTASAHNISGYAEKPAGHRRQYSKSMYTNPPDVSSHLEVQIEPLSSYFSPAGESVHTTASPAEADRYRESSGYTVTPDDDSASAVQVEVAQRGQRAQSMSSRKGSGILADLVFHEGSQGQDAAIPRLQLRRPSSGDALRQVGSGARSSSYLPATSRDAPSNTRRTSSMYVPNTAPDAAFLEAISGLESVGKGTGMGIITPPPPQSITPPPRPAPAPAPVVTVPPSMLAKRTGRLSKHPGYGWRLRYLEKLEQLLGDELPLEEAEDILSIGKTSPTAEDRARTNRRNQSRRSQIGFPTPANRAGLTKASPASMNSSEPAGKEKGFFKKMKNVLSSKDSHESLAPPQHLAPLASPEPPAIKKVFGIDLGQLSEYGFITSIIAGQRHDLPAVAFASVEEIYRRGMKVPGLLRLAGDANRVTRLTEVYDSAPDYGEHHDLTGEPIHNVTALLKKYLRDLPEPIFDARLWRLYLTTALESTAPHRVRVASAQLVLRLLPSFSFSLLVYLVAFLSQMPLFPENRLTLASVAIIFGPAAMAPRGAAQTAKYVTKPGETASAGLLVKKAQDGLLWLLDNWSSVADGLLEPDFDVDVEDILARPALALSRGVAPPEEALPPISRHSPIMNPDLFRGEPRQEYGIASSPTPSPVNEFGHLQTRKGSDASTARGSINQGSLHHSTPKHNGQRNDSLHSDSYAQSVPEGRPGSSHSSQGGGGHERNKPSESTLARQKLYRNSIKGLPDNTGRQGAPGIYINGDTLLQDAAPQSHSTVQRAPTNRSVNGEFGYLGPAGTSVLDDLLHQEGQGDDVSIYSEDVHDQQPQAQLLSPDPMTLTPGTPHETLELLVRSKDDQIQEYQRLQENQRKEVQDLWRQLTESENSRDDDRREIESLRQEVAQLKQSGSGGTALEEQLRACQEDADAERRTFEQELETKDSELKRLRLRIKSMEQQFSSIKSMLNLSFEASPMP